MTTLCYVGGELVSYQTATLTAAYRYSLAPLIRGAYGSPIAAHAIGSAFARLDEAVFKQTYAAGQIGSTIKIKLQPFNIYGGGAPDLSTLTTYSYIGAGFWRSDRNIDGNDNRGRCDRRHVLAALCVRAVRIARAVRQYFLDDADRRHAGNR